MTEGRLWLSMGTALGAVAVLIWMIAAGPGFLGYGASLLWTGPHSDKPNIYDLRVTPGNAKAGGASAARPDGYSLTVCWDIASVCFRPGG